jgi:DNA polymerase
MNYLVLDFETSSEAEIRDVGLYNYANHPSTRVLMLSYAIVETLFDKPIVKRWEPKGASRLGMPNDLHFALQNPTIEILAFNSVFERYVFQYVLGIQIPASRFQDPQASARYLSLPASLEDVGMVLGLPHELRKDKRGDQLIQLFSVPHTRKKKEGGGLYFNDWNSHPEEWKQFGEYCNQDVRAELEVARREHLLGAFPLPGREREVWLFDQKVNDRGMPTDRKFVQNLFEMADRNKKEKLDQQNKLTGLENANSPTQLLPWVQQRGYPLGTLKKDKIEVLLKDPTNKLTPECREVLKARMEAGSTSYKKLQTITENLCPDDRIRNMFVYMGSSRCGRWGGAGVQPHNFARPDGTFEDLTNVIKARQLVYDNDYEAFKTAFKNKDNEYYTPLIIAKNIIRTTFVSPQNKRFCVCDLGAIETRVGAWVAQCEPLLNVFKEGRDPYLDFASKFYGIPYDKLASDYSGINGKEAKIAAKRMRQVAKPAVLGAVYRLGGGQWGTNYRTGDPEKKGMWGYAENYGVEMTQEQAHELVRIFREAYKEIGGVPDKYTGFEGGIWYVLENAVKDVLEGKQTVRKLGPEGCIVIDKLTVENQDDPGNNRDILRIKLPSGRHLHYFDASIQMVQMPWTRKVENDATGEITEEYVHKPGFTYYGKDQTTDQWTLVVSHGGKIFENVVQAIARDVLAEKLLEFEKIGLETVGHVHDEGICLSDDDPFSPGVLNMEQIMNRPVDWALTLPLGSDGFEDFYYHK